jgi:hypothetical protein
MVRLRRRADLSVVVPALNEEAALARTLEPLVADGLEVVVVDGGSTDRTALVAESLGAEVIRAPRGRARQMNAGADHTTGRTLFFLHADSIAPAGAGLTIESVLAQPGVAAGAFRLAFHPPDLRLAPIAALANLRSTFGITYGDQGLFLRRETFVQMGGFAELPLMEDLELVRRLNRIGRVALAPARVLTSGRRYLDRGVLRQTLENQRRLWRYYRGAPVDALTADYPDRITSRRRSWPRWYRR